MTAAKFNNQALISLFSALFSALLKSLYAPGAPSPDFRADYPCSAPRCFNKCSLAMTRLISAQVVNR